MGFIKRASDIAFFIEKILVIILIPLTLISMVFDIIFRYFLNAPLVWGQEVALYSFIWSSFIGASMTIKTKSAVAVTIFVDKLSMKLRNILIICGIVFGTVFTFYIFYLSLTWIIDPSILFQKTITTQLPMIYMYISIPISLLFMTIHFISWLFEALKTSRDREVIS